MHRSLAAGVTAALALAATSAQAAPSTKELMTAVPDAASVAMPELSFKATPEDEADFDKYYVFNRSGASFAEALGDLRDCDNLARGLSSGFGYAQTPYPYAGTMAGAAGGVIANVMIQAIFGSAEKRRVRRVNMRRCMHYKGYQRYGLNKDIWQKFNFEEGFSGLDEEKRQGLLAQQAKVASGPVPPARELGL